MRLIAPGQKTPLFVAQNKVTPEAPEFAGFEDVQTAVNRAIEAGRKAGGDAAALSVRLATFDAQRQSVQALAGSGADNATIAAEATKLRRTGEHLTVFAAMLEGFWNGGGKGSFVYWRDENPWDDFDPQAVPTQIDLAKALDVQLFGNEREDVAVTLCNITSQPIDVRCLFTEPSMIEPPAPTPEKAELLKQNKLLAGHVKLLRALRTYAWKGVIRNDALPELDESGVITLAPGEYSALVMSPRTSAKPAIV